MDDGEGGVSGGGGGPVERLTRPAAVLSGGGAAAVLLAAGTPVGAAVVVGLALWLGIALGRRRRGRAPARPVDRARRPAAAAPTAWDRELAEAEEAADRFRRVTRSLRRGPLRDRLGEVQRQVDRTVSGARRLAEQGRRLEEAVADLADADLTAQMVGARRRRRVGADVEAALADRRATLARLEDEARRAHGHLLVLRSRLEEAAARAVELGAATSADEHDRVVALDTPELVGQLEALRQALRALDDEPGRAEGATR